jgi:hypothetical protein
MLTIARNEIRNDFDTLADFIACLLRTAALALPAIRPMRGKTEPKSSPGGCAKFSPSRADLGLGYRLEMQATT